MATATLSRPPDIPAVPSEMGNLRSTIVRFAQAINALLRGSIGCTIIVTLAPNATTSVFSDSRIGPWTQVELAPQTYNAANARPGIWVAAGSGNLTIHHPNSPNTDQTFVVTLIG